MGLENFTMSLIRSILLLLSIPFISSFNVHKEEWELQRNKNNISVYSRAAPDTDIKEMRAVTVVSAPVSNVVAMIKDVDYYPNWMYRCSEAKLLKEISETEYIYYTVTSVPWPIKNRDMIIHAKITTDESTGIVHVSLNAVPEYLEEKPDLVRIKKFDGKWTITPQEQGEVKLVNDVLVIPNGEVPEWMVNMAAVEGPYGTMEAMVKEVNSERFSNRDFGFLRL
jgi:ribosome-associated toxin RatA of RatAB toxin-antitoxin module